MSGFKHCLLYLLSLSILFTSGPVPFSVNKAHAEQTSSEDAELVRQQKLEELRQAILTPERGGAELDPFDLLRQRVIDDRNEKLDAVEYQMSIEDYLDRQKHFQDQIKTLNELEQKVFEKLRGVSEPSDKYAELTLVLEDIKSRRALAQLELDDLRQYDPRLGNSLPVDYMVDREIKTKHYWGNKLRLRIESSGEPVMEVKQADFKHAFSPKFSKENPIDGLNTSERDLTFSLVDPKGRHLNEFMIPVEAVFFFGHYLVFIEKNQLNKSSGQIPIRFVDLNFFKPNIGNAPLAVYTFPLNISEAPGTASIENGYLKIGQQKLSYQQFAMLSQTQQLIFNVNVALADSKTYESVQPLIDEILEFLRKSMAAKDKLFNDQIERAASVTQFTQEQSQLLREKNKINLDEVKPLLEEAMKDGKLTSEEFETIKKYLDSEKSIIDTNTALIQGRSLTNRIKLLMNFLIQPRPQGSPKVFDSLILMASGSKEDRSRVLDLSRNSFAHSTLKYGAAVGGVLLASSFLPEPYAINFYKINDLISATHQHFMGYLSHANYGQAYVEIAKDSFVTSVTGWTYFFQTYFADGVWAKFLYGLGSVLLVPLKVFSSVHLTVNSYKMFRKTLELRNLSEGELSFLQAYKNAAKQDQKRYWQELADAEKKVSGSDVNNLTEEELRLLQEHLYRLKTGRESLTVLEKEIAREHFTEEKPTSKFTSMMTGFKRLSIFGKKTSKSIDAKAAEMKLKDVDTLRQALASTFLSYSALRSTFKFNAITWNYLFITRSYVFSPVKWLMYLIYPNYFNVTVTTREGRQHFPSRYNGGLELWPQKIQRHLSKATHNRYLRDSKISNLFISSQGLKNLTAFESYVASMEAVAMEIAKKQSQKALIEKIADPKRVMVLFDSSNNPGEVSTGIKNLHDSKIKKLKRSEKIFYRAYFTRTFDVVMQGFVSQLHGIDKDMSMDPERFAKEFRKGLKNGSIEPVDLNQNKVLEIEAELKSIIDYNKIFNWASEVSKNSEKFTERVNLKFRHKLLETIHPNNPQIKRFLTVKDKVEQPRAMERAMRMEVSSLLTSIPMGVISTLALYAGVSSGLIMPFDPEALNTETHYRYMSRYLFYSGFIPGIILGLLANTWMKVQEDARVDSLGGFNKAIKFSDSSKGFWRYYLKNFLKNPSNKWADNHIYILKLVTANIPAAAVTIIVSNLYGLGRIDLGSFIGGYLIVYGTVLYGLSVKMGQAFELASSWVYAKVPRKLRASPEAQKYINGQLQKRKTMFSFYENIWEVGIVDAIAGTMFILKDNVIYGSRAFLRVVFGGETPTVLAVNFADKMIESLRSIPGVQTALEGFKTLISNNYEAFERFPEKLSMPPEGIQRAVENTSLPKNAVAEFIGKTSAMVTTLGLFTATPYVISEISHRRKEAKLQKRGAEYIKTHPQYHSKVSNKCEQLFR
ncbi:MAG: hypothetical protein MK008_06740 [Bdellovibrionales bacterium]|nr:hypothetical protein [Bdellovibrionales bacterium]